MPFGTSGPQKYRGHHFCIVRTHTKTCTHTYTHTCIYTQPAPTSSNSYTHSFQKTFLHYFSLHTHFISSLSHTHTRSLRLPPCSLRYHHCYTTPLGNWGFSSQSWVHTRAAIRRRCLLLFSSCPSLSITLSLFLSVCVGSWGTLLSSVFKSTESPVPYICSCSF